LHASFAVVPHEATDLEGGGRNHAAFPEVMFLVG
jgi:hypothetical protein